MGPGRGSDQHVLETDRRTTLFESGEEVSRVTSLVLAEGKEVAFGGEIVLITRRGKPMAKMVPVVGAGEEGYLDNGGGWLADDDPFFAAIDEIVAGRSRHVPRVLRARAQEETGDSGV